MVIETNDDTLKLLKDKYRLVSNINLWIIFDYSNFYDMYQLLVQIVHWSIVKQDRFIVNSTISFFVCFRNYILSEECCSWDELLLLNHFEKIIIRMKCLLWVGREKIYIYRANLEVIEFCKYYWFRYEIIKEEKEFNKMIHMTAIRKNII